MKKIVAVFMALVLVLASLGMTAVAEEKAHKIGILAPATTHAWLSAVAYNAEQRCIELGLDYKVTTSSNAAEMTTQLSDMILWGAEAIIVYPQWDGMEDPVQEAVDAGVIMVNFDNDIAVEGMYKVTGDNYGMGVAGAQYIVEKIGTEGIVVALPSPDNGAVNDLRMQGFMDTIVTIAPNLQIKQYATKFTREAGLADMADILVAEEHIDAIYSLDDETSIGALQAIAEAGREDIKAITGGGGCQEYFNMMAEFENIWVQSALYSPMMVRDAVDMAVAVLEGQTVETPVVVPTSIVDKTNYTEYLDENTPY